MRKRGRSTAQCARQPRVSVSDRIPDAMLQGKSVADRIMARIRSRKAGQWICIPGDFVDLGSPDAVNQALSRLVKAGQLRRVGHGLYDFPRWSWILNRPAPADLDVAIAALARRDGVKVVPDGSVAANQLGLTNAVPARPHYLTDGTSRTLRIGGHTVRLRHASPRKMRWSGKPAAPVVLALQWLGPDAASDPRVALTLMRRLPDAVKRSLARERQHLPGWMVPIARHITADSTPTR